MPKRVIGRSIALSLVPALFLAAGCGESNVTGVDEPPTVTLIAPAPGEVVSPVGFGITALANDNESVSRVDFYVDTTLVGTDDDAPYQFFMTSLGLDSTVIHLVSAVALDEDGGAAADSVDSIRVRPRSYRRLTSSPLGQRSLEPAWRPDGQEIAFSREGTLPGTTKNIYTVSAFATAASGAQATHSLQQDGNPSYSPDGAWIAYESNSRSFPFYQIFAANPATGDSVQLTSVASDQRRPSWNPTAGLDSRIAYESDRFAAEDIFMLTVTPGPDTILIAEPETPVDTHPQRDFGPAWSYAGDLAINSERNGDFAVVVLISPFPADSVAQVNGTSTASTDSTALMAPSFSPLDTHVAFVENVAEDRVWVVPVHGNGAVRYNVAPGDLLFPEASDPAWSPDGTRIAFVSSRDTGVSEIWILE